MRAALHQIEAEIANIDMPPAIDDHVVDGAGCDARKIDQRRELIVFEGEELPIEHRRTTGLRLGRNPIPPEIPGTSNAVLQTPSRPTDRTVLARLSTIHNLRACQRGPSKYFPSLISGRSLVYSICLRGPFPIR